MSAFDDTNDDSIIEIPVFERIHLKTSRQLAAHHLDHTLTNDSEHSPPLTSGQQIPQTDDKSNETFTLDSDSSDGHVMSNHDMAFNDISSDSIQVVFESPTDPNKDTARAVDNEDMAFGDLSFTTVIDANQSMRSIGSDWTPIKPSFINRTPLCQQKSRAVPNHIKCSLKKSINCLNRKKSSEQKVSEKGDKEKEKSEKRAEKELTKQREKVNKEVLRSQDIKQSLKYCIAIIDRNLYEVIKQFLDDLFGKHDCSHRLTDSPSVPMSVTWIRKCLSVVDGPQTSVQSESSQASVANTEVPQKHILVVIECNDFIQRVHSFVTKNGETLFDFVKDVVQKSNIKNITLLALKLENYFKRQKTKSQNQFKQRFNELNANEATQQTNRRRNGRRDSMPSITREEVDLALIDMDFQLTQWDSEAKVSVLKPTDWADVSVYIYRFTRSVAESVARKQRNQQQNLGWFADADKRGTVDPIDGPTHEKLWKRQLMQFPKVSYEVANAIASQYPSPQSLLKAYSRHSSPELLLSDVMVSRRQANGSNTERKMGRELSLRIHMFMTSTNGNQLLNNC